MPSRGLGIKIRTWLVSLPLCPGTSPPFLYTVAALFRIYDNITTEPISGITLTTLQWSLLAFCLGSAALLVNLSLVDLWSFVVWNTGNRSRNQAIEARERETQRDNLAEEERNKADQERSRADQERNRAAEERELAARRARVQTRCAVLQIRYHLDPNPTNRQALINFLACLEEYGYFDNPHCLNRFHGVSIPVAQGF